MNMCTPLILNGLFRSDSTENQIDAKECDMSDTLSPSKEKSSDDTSGMLNANLLLFTECLFI